MARTVIASLPEARAALAAAGSSGVAAELESPPDAAAIYGVLWFAELNRALLEEFPNQPFTLALDCGDRADLAHAALVEGIKRIRFSGHPDAERALKDIALQLGAELATRELLYVIAEPELSATDRDWIQSVRAQHDPQFDLLGPHVTLVFGTDSIAPDALVTHVQTRIARHEPFLFDAQQVGVFEGRCLFLMPDAGARELTSLHAALSLDNEESIAFVPHITIGRLADARAARRIADELNEKRRLIRGRISALKIIAVARRQARDLAVVALEGD